MPFVSFPRAAVRSVDGLISRPPFRCSPEDARSNYSQAEDARIIAFFRQPLFRWRSRFRPTRVVSSASLRDGGRARTRWKLCGQRPRVSAWDSKMNPTAGQGEGYSPSSARVSLKLDLSRCDVPFLAARVNCARVNKMRERERGGESLPGDKSFRAQFIA